MAMSTETVRPSRSSEAADYYGRSSQVLPRGSGRPREAGAPMGGPWEVGTSGRVAFGVDFGGRKGAQRAPLDPALMPRLINGK